MSTHFEGIVHGRTIEVDRDLGFADGEPVEIEVRRKADSALTPTPRDTPKPFGERFAEFKGAVPGLPADCAEQHDHYRLGTPKR